MILPQMVQDCPRRNRCEWMVGNWEVTQFENYFRVGRHGRYLLAVPRATSRLTDFACPAPGATKPE
jgi:hypothetical protein